MIIKLEDKKEMKDLVNKNVISWNKDIDQNPKLAKRKKKKLNSLTKTGFRTMHGHTDTLRVIKGIENRWGTRKLKLIMTSDTKDVK